MSVKYILIFATLLFISISTSANEANNETPRDANDLDSLLAAQNRRLNTIKKENQREPQQQGRENLLPPITSVTGIRTVLTPEIIRINEPVLVKIGDLVQKVPTAISHQSSTVVHKHAKVLTPIVAQGVRTKTQKVIRLYSEPIVQPSDIDLN